MIDHIRKIFCLTGLLAMAAPVPAADWSGPAPEQIAPVTVRWQDADRTTVLVEGENYRVAIQRQPTAIIALEVNGTNLLAAPIVPGFVDDKGVRYVPQRKGIPPWKTWQGQAYKPAQNCAARVNVWNAGPYYWDAHVLDIPLVPAAIADVEPAHELGTVEQWDFDKDAQGWGTQANHCPTITAADGHLTVDYAGEDPWFVSPVINKRGPFMVKLRLRSTQTGTAQLYYATKSADFGPTTFINFEIEKANVWQDINIPITINPTFRRFRIDPPGHNGRIEFDSIELKQLRVAGPDSNTVVRGEIVFHAFADRLNIEFRVDPEQTGVVPVKESWNWSALGRASVLLTNAPMCWVLRPDGNFDEELHPLPASSFTVRNGRYLGYNVASGLYEFEAITPGLSFNSAYDNPNRRIEMGVAIKSDGRSRRIFCKSISHVGMLPATVLADENGFMLPTPVLSCKNFAGEREEPDDTAYGDAFFPVELPANAEKRFQILHLFQNWGDHMLKQVSSIRFFNIYWHLSTGVSETTCFSIPAMKLNGVWVLIPDYRPYSGPFWPGQPQHDCQSWPGLLQYQTAAGEVRLAYDKTVFESIAPNLARFTMHFTSTDGAARAAATVMEIPQDDQMRTFLKIRYDFTKDVVIKGDARATFRWLNVNDKHLPQSLVYLDAAGQSVVTNQLQALGRPLGAEFPFVGTHGMPGTHGTKYFNSLVLIRSFQARLAGQEQQNAFFSSQYHKTGNYWLTTDSESLVLRAGDYLEAEVMLVPHAEGTEPLVVPERERRYYGTAGPTLTVTTGRARRTFPATIEADHEVVAGTVTGGNSCTPIIAGGFDHWAVPLLWVDGVWQNQQSHGGDGYQVNPDANGKYRFTFLVKQRQGHPCNFVVTRAQCTTGISRAVDRSGYLELVTAAERGEFTLKAPALFGPGVNQIGAINEFRGTAKSIRQVPLKVTPTGNATTVTVNAANEQEMDLVVAGGAELEFQSLTPDTAYQLVVDGVEQFLRTPANKRELKLSLGPGTHPVALAPAARR